MNLCPIYRYKACLIPIDMVFDVKWKQVWVPEGVFESLVRLRDTLNVDSLNDVIAFLIKHYESTRECSEAESLTFPELMRRYNCEVVYDPRWGNVRVCCGVECFTVSDIAWCKMRRLFPELALPSLSSLPRVVLPSEVTC